MSSRPKGLRIQTAREGRGTSDTVTGMEDETSRRSRLLAPALAASVLTFLVWASSPVLFEVVEPWDPPYPFYSITMTLGGVALGYRFPGALPPTFLGAWVGQVVALRTLPDHDRAWLPLGLATTAVGSFCVLAGAALGQLVRRRTASL